MKLLVPTIYQKSIYEIDYEKLKKDKVKCLLFDLDNTCVGYHANTPTKELQELFNKLTKMDFKVILFSNSPNKRLANFSTLNILLHPSSRKPFKKSFNKILKKYHYQKSNVCMIGDQLFTDILGGNRVGIKTCLVDKLTDDDFIFTKFTRLIENIVYKNFEKKGILTKGVYYHE